VATQHAFEEIKKLRGIAYLTSKDDARVLENRLTIPSFDEIKADKKKFAKAALFIEREANPYNGKKIIQYHAARAAVVNEPPLPLSTEEYDALYSLPFTKLPHPSYKEKIPADEMIRFSVAVNRGCYGGCSFCAITLHQGRIVQSRSKENVLQELQRLSSVPGFTGQVTDVGGPTANMWKIGCVSDFVQSKCKKLSCLFPSVCPHLQNNHEAQIDLLRSCRSLPGIKGVRIASGIRYDLAMADKKSGANYLHEVIAHHVGGQLKVAPEHINNEVLALMRKPKGELFEEFMRFFEKSSRECGKEQYIVPYFISGFPGCTHAQMESVHAWLRARRWNVQQVQAFIPTPMTLATAMYYANMDPVSQKEIFVAKEARDRRIQQALLQPQRPEHKKFLGPPPRKHK
jgi:uncharacterized radical SAM protein YgiQ